MGLDAWLFASNTKDENDEPERTDENTLAYWRKANQVHSYFIRTCHPNHIEDDGWGNVLVGSEVLPDLYERCRQIVTEPHRAPELLPTTEGFFFGSTNYDEFYMQDIKETIAVLEAVRDQPPLGAPIYYRWWW